MIISTHNRMALNEVTSRSILTFNRLRPRLEQIWDSEDGFDAQIKSVFMERLAANWQRLFALLHELYAERYDFHYHLEEILATAIRAASQRPPELREIDVDRERNPAWFQSEEMVGATMYVNLFSDNLAETRKRIPYFKALGISYLHLMPLFEGRSGENDGGYAINDYRSVDPSLGTIDDLRELSLSLREAGISLVLDFVFNHTSDEHDWAIQAQSGSPEHREYYFLFDTKTIPDQYEEYLREIFPTQRRGNFTWHDGMQQWVWTTFNSYQWDLNYSNPAVFRAMLDEMFFLANTGVDVLRLDAIAFIWKQLGTSCENLPQAHLLVQAFSCLTEIVAPALVFKSEAIVHPDEVVRYINEHECRLSYNPTLMALLWESLATRRVSLLKRSLSHRHQLPEGTSWVNYLRCHDDIGWTFDDSDAANLGINAYDHRSFLNRFYTGQFDGSFARGVPFQQNEQNGDMRVSGTMASLAGLEEALELGQADLVELAVDRMLLLHGVSMSIGGIPLIYLGEEWGVLNDYSFTSDPAKADDSRWIHRPKIDWEYLANLAEESDCLEATARHRIFNGLKRLIGLRKSLRALGGNEMTLAETQNEHVLAYLRVNEGHRLLCLANFSEKEQTMSGNAVRNAGLARFFEDTISEEHFGTSNDLLMKPYQLLWLHSV